MTETPEQKPVAVTLTLPKVLKPVTGKLRFKLKAATLLGAFELAYAEVPALRHHLCVESGAFRPHVLCMLNDTNTRELNSLNITLNPGDRIQIIQAISGG